MLEASDEAPRGWGLEHSEDRVRNAVMAVDPDIVMFQELPRLVPYIPTHDMIKANPETHSGNLAVLVRRELMTSIEPTFNVVNGCAICVAFGPKLSVANVHLMSGPGKDAAAMRADQLRRILAAAPTEHVAAIGDTNTRASEIEPLAAFNLRGDRPPRPTWDTVTNPFRAQGREFRAYFTRWMATPGVVVDGVDVLDAPIEHEGHRFHLSDHFAMTGRISLAEE